MVFLVIMPKLGFNMSQGKLVKWYKQEGDAVKKGDALFSIETDKTNIDIEATMDGYVRKLLIKQGDIVAVTLPIAVLADKDESIVEILADAYAQLGVKASETDVESGSVAELKTDMQLVGMAIAAEESTKGRLMASPRARKKARELGIDLSQADIEASGFEGGICEKDVLTYSQKRDEIKASPIAKKKAALEGLDLASVVGTGVAGKIMRRDLEASFSIAATSVAEKTISEATASGENIITEIIPYSGVRRIIGERLSESMQSAPHVYFTRNINMEKLLEFRKQFNENLAVSTTVTDYIAKAVIMALQKYPDLNVSLVGDRIIKYGSINLGIAVAAPTGLIVPVIKNCQKLSIPAISNSASALIDKARNGKLTPDEYTGGTFTISNLGMFGIDQFTAVINPPESGILAISTTKDEAIVVKRTDGTKGIEIKPMMNITLSVDHRVVDGMLAVQVVSEIKVLLENPIRLIMQ